MADFILGETVICSILVTNSAGVLTDPATSMKITIKDSRNGLEVNDIAMVKDATGTYHYDYTIAGVKGIYDVLYTATDGTRISKELDTFKAG